MALCPRGGGMICPPTICPLTGPMPGLGSYTLGSDLELSERCGGITCPGPNGGGPFREPVGSSIPGKPGDCKRSGEYGGGSGPWSTRLVVSDDETETLLSISTLKVRRGNDGLAAGDMARGEPDPLLDWYSGAGLVLTDNGEPSDGNNAEGVRGNPGIGGTGGGGCFEGGGTEMQMR